MAIIGLEDNNYCAHAPIPVKVTGVVADTVVMQIYIDGNPMLVRRPVLCSDLNGDFLLDLAPWVRQFMPSWKITENYTVVANTIPAPNRAEMTIEFNSESLTKTFVNCSLDNVYSPDTTPVRAWGCYPFSWTAGDNATFAVLSASPAIAGREVEFISECCKGVYLRWLNRYGDYSYWLFPMSETRSAEGEDIYNVPQNIFDDNRDGSQVSAGFDVTDTITVRDLIPRKYWDDFRDLVGSPEVHMLRDDYELGSAVTPSEWIRVIQDSPEFERGGFARTMAEFEMDLVLPEVYTQKLI